MLKLMSGNPTTLVLAFWNSLKSAFEKYEWVRA